MQPHVKVHLPFDIFFSSSSFLEVGLRKNVLNLQCIKIYYSCNPVACIVPLPITPEPIRYRPILSPILPNPKFNILSIYRNGDKIQEALEFSFTRGGNVNVSSSWWDFFFLLWICSIFFFFFQFMYPPIDIDFQNQIENTEKEKMIRFGGKCNHFIIQRHQNYFLRWIKPTPNCFCVQKGFVGRDWKLCLLYTSLTSIVRGIVM